MGRRGEGGGKGGRDGVGREKGGWESTGGGRGGGDQEGEGGGKREEVEEEEEKGGVDNVDAGVMDGAKEGGKGVAVVGWAGELLGEVDLDGGDAGHLEAEAELLVDMGGDAVVPFIAGVGEAAEVSVLLGHELLLVGRCHRNDCLHPREHHLRLQEYL